MDHPPKYRAHIVLVPMFIPSHSLPLFDFAFRLASLSIKVTILSSAHHVRQVWTHPLYWRTTARLLAAGDSIELIPVEDGLDDGTLQGFRKTVLEVASEKIFVSAFGKHLGLLMAMMPKPSCVVSDMMVGWTQELAKEFGIPRFELHIQAASNLSFMLHVPKIIPIGPLLLPNDFPLPSARVVVDEISEENRTVMQWLNLQPSCSVLYIAFGTLVKNELERFQEIAFALESSKQTFLWLAGTQAMKRPNEPLPQHISELLPLGFEERTRKQGKVVTSVVPQIHILLHPACSAFLSHCGWNAVLEIVTSAVPIIAWPQQYEQWMTARYLIDTVKVAAELQEETRGFVRREEIQRVVRLVMHQADGMAFRTRAAELKQAAAKYAYCNTHLDSFLDGLIT